MFQNKIFQNRRYKKVSYLILFLGVGLTLLALKVNDKKVLSTTAYLDYFVQNKNDLSVEVSSSHIEYTLQYLPTEYQISRELQRNRTADATTKKEELQAKYAGHHYFDLIIKSKYQKGIKEHLKKALNLPKLNDYAEQQKLDKALNDLSFHAKDNFSLVMGRDTQSCVLYHLEREQMTGMGMRYALIFKGEEIKEGTIELHYKNKLIEPRGVSFELSGKTINEQPNLRF